MEQWPRDGIPAKPRPWLVSTGRFKAIDGLRRRARFDASLSELAGRLGREASDAVGQGDEDIEDDRLRLIFTCCHPALPPDGRVALTLREVYGLTTEDDLVLLEDQVRSFWNREQMAEGTVLAARALSSRLYCFRSSTKTVHVFLTIMNDRCR